MASKLSGSSAIQLEIELMDAGERLFLPSSSYSELVDVLAQMEQILSRVQQLPSESMKYAMHPIIEALIAKELVKHPDMDVNILVASCICEILRIMAPNLPYNDQQMKDFFELATMTFKKLSSECGGCFTRLTKVLKTFSSLKLSVLMLDLKLDKLVVQLFKQFLTVADSNSSDVGLEMEKVMTMMIEKSDQPKIEVVGLLVKSVRKDNQIASPVCWKLGEKVFKNCAGKLKPHLPDIVRDMGIPLQDFSEIVAHICNGALQNEAMVPLKKEQMQDINIAGTPTASINPPAPTTPINTGSLPEYEPEEEFVLETQPKQMVEELVIQRRRKSKKRAIPYPDEAFPSTPIRWKKDEVVCLTECYFAISEDEAVGNAQVSDDFWLRVLRLFHEKRGQGIYRNRDMITAKWREINLRVTRYNRIYTTLVRDIGVLDEDLTGKAREQYELEMHHTWSLDACWKICKDHPKWTPIEGSSSQRSGSKRSRAPSTEESVESTPASCRQPLGRAAAKNAAKRGESLSSQQTKANKDMDAHIELQKQQVELERILIEELQRARESRERQLQLARESRERDARQENDRAIIAMDITQFEGEQLDRVLTMKLEAMERLGMN